jgi:CRISPR-associated protein Csb1
MMNTPAKTFTSIDALLASDGPACLIVKARFEPIGGQDRFQPAGFPEMGHVIYDAPRSDESGKPMQPEKVCIVDSAASMANHLETVCFANAATGALHPDLEGLPYVRCVTDRNGAADATETNRMSVLSSLTEGHRLASDYFLDGFVADKTNFREKLRKDFGIIEVKKDKTYFITPENWWSIYRTIFNLDPNSLVHGILFAKEQIKISRVLTAHLEAFGAGRVGSSGVKFDRLGKTTSGQPIFSKDEETAQRIEATFLIDLGLLRSYGFGDQGLSKAQKGLLLNFSLWKIERMLSAPFRFRSGCHLRCVEQAYATESGPESIAADAVRSDIQAAIKASKFGKATITDVYYPASELFTAKPDATDVNSGAGGEVDEESTE